MEVIILILAILILIIVLGIKNDTAKRLRTLDEKFEILKDDIRKSRSAAPPVTKTVEKESEQFTAPVIKTAPVKTDEIEKPAAPVSQESRKEVIKEANEPALVAYSKVVTPVPPTVKPVPSAPSKPGFFERNPDLEKFIGENLANKIGIGVLVLGIGFFVKYAIDQEWINEIGRVFIGILCGGSLLAIAHRLRKTFSAFSSVLIGGGIAVLYLTIAIAFHEYHIFSQTSAFIIMLIITGFAVVFSLAYNRIELAVLSILGGFASPFMVSTGEGNYVVLFTYILILDVGMLVLAYYKKWNLVNIISYAFTILLFGIWLGGLESDNVSMITGAMIFATLFYLVFFAMNIINNIKEKTAFKAIEISILLSNTFFYYGAGMYILSNTIGNDFRGLFTATLGIFNFVFAYLLYKNSRVDRNLVFMLIGLVLTFISLAAPVQLEGNYITLFWSAETVLVLWLSQKSGIRLMKLGSIALMILMLLSLVMDWGQIYLGYGPDHLRIILNKGYVTGIFAIASIVITLILLKQETSERKDYVKAYRSTLLLALAFVVYMSQFLELQHQLFEYGFTYATQNIIIGTYNMLFVLCLLLAERRLIKEEKIKFLFSFWGVVTMIAYIGFYHWQIIESRQDLLLNAGTATGFIFHYILVSILLVIAVFTLNKIQKQSKFNLETGNAYSWVYVAFFLFIASSELDHLVVISLGTTAESIEHIITQNHKIGYPILWGVSSFLLIYVGLKRKTKHLRVISLSLFLVTLLKLFIVDIRGISEGGKIAAFICLGVLLLVVSFMYQRLKKLLLADERAVNSSANTEL